MNSVLTYKGVTYYCTPQMAIDFVQASDERKEKLFSEWETTLKPIAYLAQTAKKIAKAEFETGERNDCLSKAHAIIYGEREQTYGDPGKNLRTIAEYWSTHLSSKYHLKLSLTVDDVCGMMILLKQARLANTPNHIDSIIDLCGYAALQERVQVATKENMQNSQLCSLAEEGSKK